MTSPVHGPSPVPLRLALSFQTITTGVIAGLVGFGSSFAVVVQGLLAVGATPEQAASGLTATCIMMGVAGVLFSLRLRQPISIAWTTPGAALLAATGVADGGFAAAVGAFLLVGALIILCGLWRPLGTLIQRIPSSIANAMLAGILLPLCLAPFTALKAIPMLAVPVVLAWAVTTVFSRLYAVPVAVLVALVLMLFPELTGGQAAAAVSLAPSLSFVTPTLTGSAVVGIALPLFLVTMASQNVPGLAILAANGYRPNARPLFAGTGLGSMLSALCGGLSINLAAITAALCAGPEASSSPDRRYIAALMAGLMYVGLAVLSAAAAALVSQSPPLLIQAVAGLALMNAFAGAAVAGFQEAEDRLPAVLTFLITASGLSLWGIGPAFWGLICGLLFRALLRATAKPSG
ncbi:benzoate/H(+) symporter BenE family transporter [Novispirillum itersonii]|uniref:benzoate/H(+) symporter BenE family transporter n=1 Tax=Novispirillum itersonii TaxID=189 RepID=UPI00036BAEC4|nr:benzoate/H(+) symporter BenE family transporter [Novispirillum itersonii]